MLETYLKRNKNSEVKVFLKNNKWFLEDETTEELLDLENSSLIKRLSYYKLWLMENERTSISFDNFIISPGEVLVKKASLFLKDKECLVHFSKAYDLRESLFNFNLFDSLQDPVLITESEPVNIPGGPRIIYANKAFYNQSGYDPFEIIGFQPSLLQGEETTHSSRSEIKKNLLKWIPFKQEILNYKKNGEKYLVELNINPVKDETGWFTHWVSLQRNITQEKENLERKSFEEKRFKRLEQVGQIGFWELDVETGKSLWSDEVYRIHNIDKTDYMKKEQGISFYAPHEQERITKCVEDCVNLKKRYDSIFEFYDSEGVKKWVRSYGEPIVEEDGRVKKIFGTFQDVSEQVRSEQEIKLINEKVGLAFWRLNLLRNELYWDDSMYDLYEVNKNDFSGDFEAWERTLHPDDKESSAKLVQRCIEEGKDLDATFAIITGDGNVKYIAARATIIIDGDGKPIEMVGVNFDKTAEVKAQKLLDAEKTKLLQASKLASLGEMAASVAHEIKNPLSIINNSVDLIKKLNFDPQKSEKLMKNAKDSVIRISNIVSGLSRFARSSDLDNRDTVDIVSIFKEVETLIEPKSKKYSVSVMFEQESPQLIVCNTLQIEQVLVNLIGNSIDSVKSQDIKWVRVFSQNSGDKIEIFVQDSGQGIEQKLVNKLFDPFFTTKKVGEGTGLGLSISRGIIIDHGGDLSYELVDGHTTFKVSLPLVN